MYRVTLDQIESNIKRAKFESIIGYSLSDYKYEIAEVDFKVPVTKFISNNYNIIGWFKDMNDLLENCYIQGRNFKEVIMDDSTYIDSKD